MHLIIEVRQTDVRRTNILLPKNVQRFIAIFKPRSTIQMVILKFSTVFYFYYIHFIPSHRHLHLL